jgi:hypothetical protein
MLRAADADGGSHQRMPESGCDLHSQSIASDRVHLKGEMGAVLLNGTDGDHRCPPTLF